MTWDAFHRRGDVLRAVVDEVNTRRDGVLPRHLPGVAAAFGDDVTLVGALQLRWHTLLAGMVERELMEHPGDPETAVVTAWRRAYDRLPGVRLVLDRCASAPTSEPMARSLEVARRKEWALLAAMAGWAAADEPRAASAGRRLEQRAREAREPELVA